MAWPALATTDDLRSETSGAPTPAVSHRRLFGVLGPLALLLVLWLYLFYAEGAFRGGPNGKTFGADFAMFVTAAQVMQAGGNPYDHQVLYRAERTWMAKQHLSVLHRAQVVRVGNPPILFRLLQPFAFMPFQVVAYAWMIGLYALSALGFLLLLRTFGWRRRAVPTLLFLLMPQVVLGPFYGNVTTLVFFAACAALVLARRYPLPAGAILALAWLKPPVGLPIAALILLFHSSQRARMMAGMAAGTLLFFALNVLVVGPRVLEFWLRGLVGYSQDVGSSPAIASFAGLYVRSIPHGPRLGIEILVVSVGVVFTALAWHRHRSYREVPWARVAWLWAVWFLAAPYAHFFDEILLAAPILALLGRDGHNLSRREPVIALYVAFASLLLISAAPFDIQLLWVPLVVLMLVLYLASRDDCYVEYLTMRSLPWNRAARAIRP